MTLRGVSINVERMEKLERALTGALQAGDRQADELVRLSGISARQRRALWRAFILLKQGRYDADAAVMETECRELRDQKERP